MNKRMKKSLWALVGTMLCGCLLLAPGARAAETTALEDTLEQTARLQQLAEEYAAGQQTEMEPLTLTINYIRAQRYADTTWDMILGSPVKILPASWSSRPRSWRSCKRWKTWKFRPPANRWILCIWWRASGPPGSGFRWSAPGAATASSWPAASRAPAWMRKLHPAAEALFCL